MFEMITRWRKTRRTANELNSMTDRELRDLGISRYDIWTIAKQSVR